MSWWFRNGPPIKKILKKSHGIYAQQSRTVVTFRWYIMYLDVPQLPRLLLLLFILSCLPNTNEVLLTWNICYVQQLEALKTQLEFKEREIIETQTSFRNLQQRTCQDGKTSKSNCPSPRKSPRLIQVGSPSRQVFPTKALFMTGGAKQLNGQRSPVTKKGSPLKNQNRPSKSKSPGLCFLLLIYIYIYFLGYQ